MATCIHSSRSCLLPFYTIPIFPLLNRKIFHLYIMYVCMCASIVKASIIVIHAGPPQHTKSVHEGVIIAENDKSSRT